MNLQRPPTTYQLCRIAAALHGKGASTNPERAVKAAMKLWSTAASELDTLRRLEEQNESEKASAAFAVERAAQDPDSEVLLFLSPDESVSPVMDWVSDHAESHRDRFKTFQKFRDAWLEIYPGDKNFHDVAVSKGHLRDFLSQRVARRRAREARRKQQSRMSNQIDEGVREKSQPDI